MADVLQKLLNLNFTENVLDVPKKKPATPEGMVLAYASLIIMSMLPIIFGSLRSVKHHQERTQHQKVSGQKVETMSQSDAAFFPIFASMALFALYVMFKLFSKDYINLLLTGYFFVLGVLALSHLACPVVSSLVPASIPNVPFQLKFTSGKGQSNVWINYEFTSHDIVCLVCCSLVGASYLLQKHWIVNNLFGIAFAINSVELLLLNNVVTGCILLCGLFVYDIFWVFGTNVMVTVASSFEAPIKLVFPQDLIEHGFTAKNFAMIGLGDIVIPGIFIALLLRFDNSLKRKTSVYFYTTITAYFIGLLATMFVMHLFNHAQPALLYLVPACLGTPILLALVRGDIGAMFQYEDHPSEKTSKTEEDTKKPAATKSVPKTKKIK